MTDKKANLGSAETGGEKAAPPKEDKWAYFEAQARNGSLYMGSNYLVAKDGSVWDCMMWAGGGIADITQFLPSHPDFCVIYRDAVLRKDTVFENRPNFPRSSQNQTVSGGVDGAHEGTAADKSGSREPEKLNNAQKEKECPFCGSIEGKEHHEECDYRKAQEALAESSLSSPLPKEK